MSQTILRRSVNIGATATALLCTILVTLWGTQPQAQRFVTNSGPFRLAGHTELGYAASAHLFDPASDRLYSSTRGGVVTVNPTTRKLLGRTTGVRGSGSLSLDAARGELYVLALHDDRLQVVDVTTHKVIRAFAAPAWFNVFYEPSRGELWYLRGDTSSMQVADRLTGRTLATVDLGGRPAYVADDPARHRVFVRLADQPKIQVIDTVDHAVVASWPARRDGPSALTMDRDGARVFTTAGKDIVLLDGATGRELARAGIGDITTSLVFDEAAGYLLALTTRAEIVAIKVDGTGMTVAQILPTHANVQDLYLDPDHQRVLGLSRIIDEGIWGGGDDNGATRTTLITLTRK